MDFAVDYDIRLETNFTPQQITEVVPQPNYNLLLKFKDGTIGTIDIKPLIEKGGVFTALGGTFNQVQIAPSGRFIVWPDEIDLCADALYIEIKHQAEAENPHQPDSR